MVKARGASGAFQAQLSRSEPWREYSLILIAAKAVLCCGSSGPSRGIFPLAHPWVPLQLPQHNYLILLSTELPLSLAALFCLRDFPAKGAVADTLFMSCLQPGK